MAKHSEGVALDRDALYYPYIHIKSLNWLKSTLLCFPQVRRIVPGGYSPSDSKEIREFLTTEGARGMLLADEHPYGGSCESEQARLAARIKDDLDTFKTRFSKSQAKRDYPKAWNDYRIYYLKINGVLRNALMDHGLAWKATPKSHEWYSLHPRLGRAVMSTIAIAIANDRGLDIVTFDEPAHRSICTQQQSDVFDELLGLMRHQPPQASHQVIDDLAAVFMTTYFDASKLTAPQIAHLQKDGKDLRRFKDAIRPIALQIPDIPNEGERRRRLKAAAAEINNEWKKYKKSLPQFALDAIFDATEAKLPAAVTAALGAGAVVWLPFGLTAGLAVGFTAYAGFRMWRKFKEASDSPYQYLNRIHLAGATLVAPTAVKAN
jgi:hypothetical protein